MNLYFIRHGQSFVNLKSWSQGNVDTALTPKGRMQAEALAAWLQAFISNQLQAAIRLSVTAQNGAARLLAALEPAIAAAADRATRSTPDDLGSFAFTAEIASMKHETLQPRLFLS